MIVSRLGEGGSRCPVCATPVTDAPRRCEACDTPHHPECWDYLGGCAIFGCRASASRSLSLSSSSSSSSSSSFSSSSSPPLPLIPPDLQSLKDDLRTHVRRQVLALDDMVSAITLMLVGPFKAWLGLALLINLVSPALGTPGIEYEAALAVIVLLGCISFGVMGYRWASGQARLAVEAQQRVEACLVKSLNLDGGGLVSAEYLMRREREGPAAPAREDLRVVLGVGLIVLWLGLAVFHHLAWLVAGFALPVTGVGYIACKLLWRTARRRLAYLDLALARVEQVEGTLRRMEVEGGGREDAHRG